MNRAPRGAICGRFHPFHREHLAYARAALERVEVLWVGLTNPEPAGHDADAAGGHRHRADANPFAFHERLEMVTGALLEDGVPAARFRVAPYPITRPAEVAHYVPADAVHFLTLYDEEPWGARKQEMLEAEGLRVEVLWSRPAKGMTSSEIRRRLVAGEPVDDLVPPFVAGYLAGLEGLAARLGG